MNEIPEVSSLRWLANMFPFVENPQDETDKMSNAIHVYCTAGADKLEECHNFIGFYPNKNDTVTVVDKIKFMQVEELAIFLSKLFPDDHAISDWYCSLCKKQHGYCKHVDDCEVSSENAIFFWLISEFKESR